MSRRAIQFHIAQRCTRASPHEIYAQALLRWLLRVIRPYTFVTLAVVDPKVLKRGRQFITTASLSRIHTTIYRPFTRKRRLFVKKIEPIGAAAPPSPLNPPLYTSIDIALPLYFFLLFFCSITIFCILLPYVVNNDFQYRTKRDSVR